MLDFAGGTVEHNTHVAFSSNLYITCTVQRKTTLYTLNTNLGHAFWMSLVNYWLGVTIIINLEQGNNTHFQWGRACWVDRKSHILAMAISAAVLCMWITCRITAFYNYHNIVYISPELLLWVFWLWYFSSWGNNLYMRTGRNACFLKIYNTHAHK